MNATSPAENSATRASRVLLVDDRPLVLNGLRVVLDGQQDLEVVGERNDVVAAAQAIVELAPDVIVLHGEPAKANTFAAVRRFSTGPPPRAVLLMTGISDTETTLRAVHAGASGHLSTAAPPNEVLAIVRAVAIGAVVLPPSVRPDLSRYLLGRLDDSTAGALRSLDQHEQRLLALLAAGRSNTEIAQDLLVSLGTVKKHLSQVLRKLGLRDRLQAGLYAYQQGLGEPIRLPERTDRAGRARVKPLPRT